MEYIEKNKNLWEEHFKHTSLDYPNEAVIRFLAKSRKLYDNPIMLDWGCATGRHTVLGCKLGYNVYAYDYVEYCVEVTKSKLLQISADDMLGKVLDCGVNQALDVESIQNEELDIILAWGILFYNTAENQELMLRSAYRMLKKGGRIFCDFRTPNDTIYRNDLVGREVEEDTFLLESKEMTKGKDGMLISILPIEKIQAMFQKVGLVIENIELSEFTQDNQKIKNSWWQVEAIKP